MGQKIYLLLFLSLILTLAVRAQKPFRVKDIDEKPVVDAPAHYSDLLLKIFPDLGFDEKTESPTINRSFDLRRLSGGKEYTLYESPLEITGVEAWWFQANGEKHLALLLSLMERPTEPNAGAEPHYALAVFRYVNRNEHYGVGDKSKIRTVREFRPVEVVDPEIDRFVEFPDEYPLIEISPGNHAFWILNHHWNAGENFRSYQLVRVGAGNRLSLAVENLPGLYFSAACSDNREDSFYVEPLKRSPANFLPYDFGLRTLIWSKKQCERAAETSYPTEELRLYRARRATSKNRRRVLRLSLVKFTRKRVKIVRGR